MDIFKASIGTVEETELQQKITAIGQGGEEIIERSLYGMAKFHSTPKKGAIGVVIADEENVSMVATTDTKDDRPDDIEKLTVIYQDKNKFIGINESGEITIANDNNKVILKENGDIELGDGSLAALVKDAVLSALAIHTHPVSGAVALASTDPAMLILATDPANTTQKVKAQ